MMAAQMRFIRPLTKQHPAAQVVLTLGALSLGPLLFWSRWVVEYGETFAEVMRPAGRRI